MNLIFENVFVSLWAEELHAQGGGSLPQFVWGVILSDPTGSPSCFIWLRKTSKKIC